MLPEQNVISAFLSLFFYCNPYLLQFLAAISLPGLFSGELFPMNLSCHRNPSAHLHSCVICTLWSPSRQESEGSRFCLVLVHSCTLVCTVQGKAQLYTLHR